ncbi:PAQR family membrane homeostasis protein TrhA [Shewanella pealeana]|uniref:Channel protein, hemolysin III family n=1 Tax=Shewanella pealeana (strain ATCC 700345 / ANG-SQ1) TaxID=398579 RepID=A8H568_SHEPA|nr:hemolysin III family protein [Shewanella pealeana]ABV87705.1 channel protein, hemolysin III family [Shewanella pealeana ATCC 700345]
MKDVTLPLIVVKPEVFYTMAVEQATASDNQGSHPTAKKITVASYCAREELANSISHGIGVIVGIVGLILCLLKGFDHLSFVQLTGVVVYCSSIILLFLCSTLYHSATSPMTKHRLKIADHCAIYLLIAGTYTPLMLITLTSSEADWILIAIWSLAIGGVLFKTLFIGRFKAFSLVLYLVMGWLCVTVMQDLIANMSDLGFNLLIAGGLFYSLGVIFYVAKRIPFNHAIWHLFVLGGAVCHFLCIYLTVI